MTERGYQAALRLSRDPGATPAERENAAARCREHEAAQAKAPPQGSHARVRFGFDIGADFSDVFYEAMRNPFWRQPPRAEPPPPRAPPPKIVRVSAADIKRYGSPLHDPRDRPNLHRPSAAERERYGKPES